MKRRGPNHSSILRRRRQRAKEARALRAGRLEHGLEAALEEEEALLGAVHLEPFMIAAVARERPPAWWVGEGNRLIFEALYLKWRTHRTSVDMDATIRDYERRGGKPEVAANMRKLVAPRIALEAARAWLADLRRRLPPIEREPIVATAMTLLDAEPEKEVGAQGEVAPVITNHDVQLVLFPEPAGSVLPEEHP